MPDEKRKSQRIKENFSILCSKIYREIELEGNLSKVIDISTHGLSFTTAFQLLKGDILQIIIRIPPAFQEKVEVYGKVIECQKANETEFKVRTSFLDVTGEAENILNRLTQANPNTP